MRSVQELLKQDPTIVDTTQVGCLMINVLPSEAAVLHDHVDGQVSDQSMFSVLFCPSVCRLKTADDSRASRRRFCCAPRSPVSDVLLMHRCLCVFIMDFPQHCFRCVQSIVAGGSSPAAGRAEEEVEEEEQREALLTLRSR